MKRQRISLLGLVLAVSLLATAGVAYTDNDHPRFRWDIVSIDVSSTPPSVNAGGVASARAEDGSKITLTGKGTFVPARPHRVTGGGTWKTFDAQGRETGKGRYRVTSLVDWHEAPGSAPEQFDDNIGDERDARAGFVVLKIHYSNGQTGHLVVSCHLVGTPDTVFEGVTASMGFVGYWNREAPSNEPFVDANRTVFHVKR